MPLAVYPKHYSIQTVEAREKAEDGPARRAFATVCGSAAAANHSSSGIEHARRPRSTRQATSQRLMALSAGRSPAGKASNAAGVGAPLSDRGAVAARGQGVARLGDDLERSQARPVIVDLAGHHQLVGTGELDEVCKAAPHRLG